MPIVCQHHGGDAISASGDPGHGAIEANDAAITLDPVFDNAPHHAWPQARVVKGIDQSLNFVFGLDKHAQDGGLERQILDALRRPFGFKF